MLTDLLHRRSKPSRSQLRVKPATPIDKHQGPHLVMGQVDHVAIAVLVAAVALDDTGGHQFVDDE